MKILFAGTPEPAAVSLEFLANDDRFDVVGVLTQPDAPRGRGRKLRPSHVADVAERLEIPVHKFPSLKATAEEAQDVRDTLRNYRDQGVEAVAVVAYGNLIPADLVDEFTHGWINLHFSLLPRWRGAAPVQAAIAAGDPVTGASTFRIEKGLDTGPVVDTLTREIGIEDSADDLLTTLAMEGRQLLADSLWALHRGTASPAPQDEQKATHAAKLTPQDARISWDSPAQHVQRSARAHTPAPGPWTLLDGRRYKIGLLLPVSDEDAPELAAGQIWASKKAVLVGTADKPLKITQIQPPGKKMMDATAWARGQQGLLESGARFDEEES